VNLLRLIGKGVFMLLVLIGVGLAIGVVCVEAYVLFGQLFLNS